MSETEVADGGGSAIGIGMAAGQFVVALVRAIPHIETVRLLSYAVSPSLDARLSALPGGHDSNARARAALMHDPSGRTAYEVRRSDLTEDYLEALTSTLAPNVALAITSAVGLRDGSTGHIPMLDLRCDVSSTAQSAVAGLFQEIGSANGALLDSGQSYHYYGFDVIKEPDWRIFLGKCLLSTMLVDTRYIAHRLIDGFCSLRINQTTTKPQIPAVVEWW